MNALPITVVISAVTSLSLGLTFLYLWWWVLRRRYVLLLGLGRLLLVPFVLLITIDAQRPSDVALGTVTTFFSALSMVAWVAGIYDFVYRRLRTWPLVALAVGLTAWQVVGPHLAQGYVARELPDAAVRSAVFLWTAWLIYRGPHATGRLPLAALVALTGLHALDYPYLARLNTGIPLGLTISTFLSITLSVLLLILLLDEAQRAAAAAERGRAASEERFRAIVEHAPIGVAAVAASGVVEQANAAFATLLRRDAHAMAGRPLAEVVSAGDAPEVARSLAALREGTTDFVQQEVRFTRPDGTTVRGWLSASQVREGDGGDQTVLMVEDLTERERARTADRERGERLRVRQKALLRLAGRDALYTGDVGAAWRAITESAAYTLDVERAGVWLTTGRKAGIGCVDLYERPSGRHTAGADLASSEAPAYFRSIELGRTIAAADALTDPRTADLRAGYLEPHGIASMFDAPIRVRGKTVGVMCLESTRRRSWSSEDEGFVASLADLAVLVLEAQARRVASDTLRENERRYRAAFEQAAVGLAEVGEDGRLLRVNRRLCEVLGYTEDDLRRSRFTDVVHPDDVQAELEFLRRPARDGGAFHRQLRFLRMDGSTGWAEVTTSPVEDAEGAPRVFLSVLLDVTERVSLEAQLVHSQKLEALGRLAGGVAHDFNNILSAILGYSDLLRHTMGPDDPRRRDLDEIQRAGDRAAGLVRQLLAFAREQTVEPRVVHVERIVRNLEPMLRRLIGEDVVLSVLTAPATAPIRVDPGRFEQVLMNLVVNARDAMPAGGQLTIEVSDIVLGEEYVRVHRDSRVGRHTLVAVTDTGVGMRPEVLARVFEPFFTTKAPGKGSGLGLATSYGIIRQAGGNILVYSEPGRGTTFKLYLPAADGPPADEPRPADPAPLTTGTETILLVEDEPSVRTMVARVLGTSGYTMLVAEDGEEALAVAAGNRGPIHLLVTDVVMPRLNGADLARRLTAERPDLKVIFISGYTEDSATRLAGIGKGSVYLSKPFSVAALARRVRDLLDGRS